MPIKLYACRGCGKEYRNDEYSYTDFDFCVECMEEICMSCGMDVKGKLYCRECKPITTNNYMEEF